MVLMDFEIYMIKVSLALEILQTLETDANSYGSLLLPLINAKLPTDICVLRTIKFKSENWHLNEMIEVLGTEIEANKTSAREKLMK